MEGSSGFLKIKPTAFELQRQLRRCSEGPFLAHPTLGHQSNVSRVQGLGKVAFLGDWSVSAANLLSDYYVNTRRVITPTRLKGSRAGIRSKEENGSDGRDRTYDQLINSQLLYR